MQGNSGGSGSSGGSSSSGNTSGSSAGSDIPWTGPQKKAKNVISRHGVDYYVFNPTKDSKSGGWTTVEKLTVPNWNFEWTKFFAFMQLGDTTEKNHIESGTSFITGIMDSFIGSVSNTFIVFEFQKGRNGHRVILKAGSSSYKDAFNKYADNVRHGLYSQYIGHSTAQDVISRSAVALYNKVTGKSEKDSFGTAWDIRITIDSQHKKDNGVIADLWIDEGGNLYSKNIYYKNDLLEVGTCRMWGLGYERKLIVPINKKAVKIPNNSAYKNIINAVNYEPLPLGE